MERYKYLKKIIFLTGTRADFGKIKSLIKILDKNKNFKSFIFATGMHLNPKYGRTVDEIYNSGFKNIYEFVNHRKNQKMDKTLGITIDGFSKYVKKIKPDLIVLHGDRPEVLAGAIVGSFNNILVAHIEGGELSGTIDESIRHSVTKLSHIHLVLNNKAKKRLTQLGEKKSSIFILGSPDIDAIKSKKLPSILKAKRRYNIEFKKYSIVLYHPVTTEFNKIRKYTEYFIKALIKSNQKYIVIYPNNDDGSEFIISEYEKKLRKLKNFKIFPSIRFEYYLSILKNSKFIIGNSSSGIMEAPYFGIPTINIGSRQNKRLNYKSIYNCNNSIVKILSRINQIGRLNKIHSKPTYFGKGNSDKIFLKILNSKKIWNIKVQKSFQDFK